MDGVNFCGVTKAKVSHDRQVNPEFAAHLASQLTIAVVPSHERFLSLKEVEAIVGLKRSAIYERIKSGEFPAQLKLSHRSARWSAIEIERWMQAVKSFN